MVLIPKAFSYFFPVPSWDRGKYFKNLWCKNVAERNHSSFSQQTRKQLPRRQEVKILLSNPETATRSLWLLWNVAPRTQLVLLKCLTFLTQSSWTWEAFPQMIFIAELVCSHKIKFQLLWVIISEFKKIQHILTRKLAVFSRLEMPEILDQDQQWTSAPHWYLALHC